MNPLHPVQDTAKVAQIAESLEANGWQGAPLVCDGENLLTGVHRYAAAQSLDWTSYDIPTIEIAEIFEANGLDWDAMVAEENGETEYVLMQLPQTVLDQYGIDV